MEPFLRLFWVFQTVFHLHSLGFSPPLSLKLQHIRMPNWRLCTKQMTTLASPLLTRPSSCVWLWCIKHSASTLLSHKLQCRLALIWRLKQRELVFLHNSNPPTSCLFYSCALCLCWGRAITLEHRIIFKFQDHQLNCSLLSTAILIKNYSKTQRTNKQLAHIKSASVDTAWIR